MPRTRRPLSGRPVMITGAASGIGRSLARLLSGTGSPVAIADTDAVGLKETAAALTGPVLPASWTCATPPTSSLSPTRSATG